MAKVAKKQSATSQLGHNYVYHFNEFETKWYCIHRDSYMNYWNKNFKNDDYLWTFGKSPEEAAEKMLKNPIRKKKEAL